MEGGCNKNCDLTILIFISQISKFVFKEKQTEKNVELYPTKYYNSEMLSVESKKMEPELKAISSPKKQSSSFVNSILVKTRILIPLLKWLLK